MKHWISNNLYTIILSILLIIVTMSVVFTTRLANQFAQEEYRKIELWAEATKQLILADEDDNIDLILSVMEGNTTIPVYMVDTNYNYTGSRNVKEPKKDVELFYANKIAKLRDTQEPIEVRDGEVVMQYIYYEPSSTLRWLSYFPYIQIIVMIALAGLAAIALVMMQRSEQNSLWVGLSKETAHQLGTPISSLNAWNELLKAAYPNDPLLPQMDEDIRRLQMIAERFSKIGSQPVLEPQPVARVLQDTVEYMRVRTSSKVEYRLEIEDEKLEARAMLCAPLFQWVIENICKNAVDSMEGKGSITIVMQTALRSQKSERCTVRSRIASLSDSEKIYIDITDTGKGIDRRKYKKIFRPGYTSKKRGWGLGLSLANRIIEDYHRGKLFVKQSQLGIGTTFRIVLGSIG